MYLSISANTQNKDQDKMFSVRRYIAVAKKEYLELKRNILFFLMTILAPLILFFLFAFAFSLEARNIPIAFADHDKSELSRRLIDKFVSAGGIFDVRASKSDYASLEKDLGLDRLRAVIFIPADFSEKIKKGIAVRLDVMIDGTNPTYANLVSAYAQAVLSAYQAETLSEYFTKRLGLAGAAYTPIDLSVSAWYNSSFRSEDFVIPGVVAIIIMFFPPIVAALSLAREKETGSILNMYCSSVTKLEYLLGKMTPYVIISYVNCLLFIVFALFIFNVPMRGNPFYLVIASFFYSSSAIAFGLLVAVLVSTQVAAIIISSIITLTPSFMYSGFMVPVSNLGSNALFYTYSSPATYYIDLIRKIMVKGASLRNISYDMFMIIVISAVIYLVSIGLFKKRVG